MGITDVQGTISHQTQARRKVPLQFLVDTGAFFTVIPTDILHTLGIRSAREERVRFADNRTATWKAGEARLSINGRSTTTWVLFGKPNSQPLLGAYSLEGLCMEVDPRTKQLKPIPTLIVASATGFSGRGPL